MVYKYTKMKHLFFLLLILAPFLKATAQTGIGTTTPDASAKLEVSATNKGFLPPRISLTGTLDVATIASPATGLVIFNTVTAGTSPNNVLPGYYYWDGAKWNGLVNQGALQSFSGYTPNYAQTNASSVTKSAVGDVVINQSITTSGRPVQIIATGDANPTSAGAWVQLQLYRDGSAIGKKLQAESSSSNENVPYCLNFIDNPTAGTYTYSVKITAGSGSNFQFGEADGNQLTLLELGAWSAGTMPVSKGGTGNSSYTSGSVLFSDGTSIAQNNTKLYWDNTNTRLGIGTNTPTQALDVTGNVNVSGKINLTDPSGNVATKVSGLVNAGTFLSLDNLKVSVTTGGSRGLSVGAVTTNFTANISAYYAMNGGVAGTAVANVAYTTTPSGAAFGWSFPSESDGSYYNILDKTNNRMYRVTLIIGASYFNNFISIERLF
jgi:hypothetical protein